MPGLPWAGGLTPAFLRPRAGSPVRGRVVHNDGKASIVIYRSTSVQTVKQILTVAQRLKQRTGEFSVVLPNCGLLHTAERVERAIGDCAGRGELPAPEGDRPPMTRNATTRSSNLPNSSQASWPDREIPGRKSLSARFGRLRRGPAGRPCGGALWAAKGDRTISFRLRARGSAMLPSTVDAQRARIGRSGEGEK